MTLMCNCVWQTESGVASQRTSQATAPSAKLPAGTGKTMATSLPQKLPCPQAASVLEARLAVNVIAPWLRAAWQRWRFQASPSELSRDRSSFAAASATSERNSACGTHGSTPLVCSHPAAVQPPGRTSIDLQMQSATARAERMLLNATLNHVTDSVSRSF